MPGTWHLASQAPSHYITNGGREHGPLLLTVPSLSWDQDEAFPDVGVENLLGLSQTFPSRPSQYVWFCQACPAFFPASEPNSPPRGNRLTAQPISHECPKQMAGGQMRWQQSHWHLAQGVLVLMDTIMHENYVCWTHDKHISPITKYPWAQVGEAIHCPLGQ